MRSRWLVFALMTLASASPAFADRRSILGLGAANYDKEGALPVGVYRFTGWQPGHPGIDAGIETVLFLNQLDLDVCYPMRFSRVTLTPRIGPTVVAGFFGGRAGLGFGGQILIEIGASSGIVLDGMHRTFSTDDIDSAWPITSFAVGMVIRVHPKSR